MAKDDIIRSRDDKCSAWYQGVVGGQYGREVFWRVQTTDEETSKRMDTWQDIWLTAYNVSGAHLRVYMCPRKHIRKILRWLNFKPLPKSPVNVAKGKRLQAMGAAKHLKKRHLSSERKKRKKPVSKIKKKTPTQT